jgi:hypothetical protein
MEFTCKINQMKEALNRTHFFVAEPQNVFPYANLSVEEGFVIVAGTNSAAYVETSIPAVVDGVGSCQVGDLFEKVLTNIPGEEVTCTVNASSISMKNDRGLKARAQIAAGEFPMRAVLQEKFATMEFVHDIVVFKNELLSLIRVSETLPPTPGKLVQWVFLKIENGEFVGATQESEIGAIEALPFNTLNFQSPGGAVVFRANTSYMKALVSLCDAQVRIKLTDDPRFPILVSDPMDENWWGSLVGIA